MKKDHFPKNSHLTRTENDGLMKDTVRVSLGGSICSCSRSSQGQAPMALIWLHLLVWVWRWKCSRINRWSHLIHNFLVFEFLRVILYNNHHSSLRDWSYCCFFFCCVFTVAAVTTRSDNIITESDLICKPQGNQWWIIALKERITLVIAVISAIKYRTRCNYSPIRRQTSKRNMFAGSQKWQPIQTTARHQCSLQEH